MKNGTVINSGKVALIYDILLAICQGPQEAVSICVCVAKKLDVNSRLPETESLTFGEILKQMADSVIEVKPDAKSKNLPN